MWRELIQHFDPAAAFAEGATSSELTDLQANLENTLPEDLRMLLVESNGVKDEYGCFLVWSSQKIAQYNQEMRTFPEFVNNHASFADVLFFADAGNGDQFGFPVFRGQAESGPIFVWNHENDQRKQVAHSLKSFLMGWLSGEISV